MLFWALLASGQINVRKVDGWQTLAERPTIQCIDLAARRDNVTPPETTAASISTSTPRHNAGSDRTSLREGTVCHLRNEVTVSPARR